MDEPSGRNSPNQHNDTIYIIRSGHSRTNTGQRDGDSVTKRQESRLRDGRRKNRREGYLSPK
ncbi:hypothetical protein EBL_c20340 [Shimwellia blattae DSM 4481 = NBRC 105725]|uniref:Uncharacterized protein n=1 Tax=Shimwellia blattae (strain ATCC 29907 / DSM 4481 / JCM 1650 / NBRC 105725 / CDC 9005-74) TaxID=630626 RepID=I2B9C1_SHIBC|nr:hypothetical protein EBL_c20340 [Shimwellia blattae DSM 4481 = NBRC 105725]